MPLVSSRLVDVSLSPFAVLNMTCVPKSGTVSHLSGRSPERVIHYEAISETGSDELTELPNTSATHMGPSVRHYSGPTIVRAL